MTHQHRPRTRGHIIFVAAIMLIVAITIAYWAWNSAGVNLFAMPPASFVEITALLFGIFTIAMLLRFILGGAGRPHRRQ